MLFIKILLAIVCVIVVIVGIGLIISLFKTEDKSKQNGIYYGMAVCVVVFILSYNYITGDRGKEEAINEIEDHEVEQEPNDNREEIEEVVEVDTGEKAFIDETLKYFPIDKNISFTTGDDQGQSVTEYLGDPVTKIGQAAYVENAYWGLPYEENPMKFYHMINEDNDIFTIGEETEDGDETWYVEPEIYLPGNMVEGEVYEYSYQYTDDLKGDVKLTFLGYEELVLEDGSEVNCIVVKREKPYSTMIEYFAEGIGSVLKVNDESGEKVHEFLHMGKP